MFGIEKTNTFHLQYKKLTTGMRRFVDEAEAAIKENPFDMKGRIKAIARRRDGRLFRFRQPGMHIFYLVHNEEPMITMTQIVFLRKLPEKPKRKYGGL